MLSFIPEKIQVANQLYYRFRNNERSDSCQLIPVFVHLGDPIDNRIHIFSCSKQRSWTIEHKHVLNHSFTVRALQFFSVVLKPGWRVHLFVEIHLENMLGPGLTEELECPNCRSEEHTSELQSRGHLVCRPLLEKKK